MSKAVEASLVNAGISLTGSYLTLLTGIESFSSVPSPAYVVPIIAALGVGFVTYKNRMSMPE